MFRPTTKKGIVTEIVDSSLSLHGSLVEVIAFLQKELEELGTKHTNLQLYQDSGYDGGFEWVILGDRPATQVELMAQDIEEAQTLAYNEVYQRQQYEVLKAKFEKKA